MVRIYIRVQKEEEEIGGDFDESQRNLNQKKKVQFE